MFIALCRLRRRHHRRWRSIWGKYPVRPLVHLGLVGLCRQELHRFRVVRLGQVDLCCQLGRGLHLGQVRRFDQVVQVGRFLQRVQGLQE